MGIFQPGAIILRDDQPPIPVLANVYENKSEPVRITGDDANHVIIGPERYEISESVNLRLSVPDTVQTSTNGVIGGTAPPNTGLQHHIFRIGGLENLVGRDIDSAKFYLLNQNTSVSTDPGSTGPVQLHVIAAANKAWTENLATWNERDSVANTAWAGTAGLRTAGTDYSSTVMGSATYSVFNSVAVPEWLEFDLDLTEFAAMVTASAGDNPGFLAKMQTEGQALGSRIAFYTEEAADPDTHPYAMITVVPDELTGVDLDLVTEVMIQASGDGVYFSNTSEATTDSFHLPDGQLVITKLNTNGVPNLSLYVETGSSVVYCFRGPIES